MLEEAFREMFPEKSAPKFNEIVYSNRIKLYNAYATLKDSEITVRVSRNYETVDKNILIGVIQSLLMRMYKKKVLTAKILEAQRFLREHSNEYKPRIDDVPEKLVESFQRVNSEYFNSALSMPIVNWGKHSLRRLGQYMANANLIRISRMLEKAPEYALDYIMYHEMLHLQRDSKRKKYSKAHTKEFKSLEDSFRHAKEAKEWVKNNLTRRKRLSFFSLGF